MASRLEITRIKDRTGAHPEGTATAKCNMLTPIGCSIYDIRPAICRVFGVSDAPALTCPHVKPETRLSEEETSQLFDTINQLGHGVDRVRLAAQMHENLAKLDPQYAKLFT